MRLLEREPQLSQLDTLLNEAANGRGRLVFLGGEAGGGKTLLIERFVETARPHTPVAIVSCDGFGLPGPFESLFDVAVALGPRIETALKSQSPRSHIFRDVLSSLRDLNHANVLVGEDAHWSDQASLDLLRFLGRRIGNTHTLIIITYRDDALAPYHPLRRVLGDLVSEPAVCRIRLPSVSADAVRTLAAESGKDPDGLFERTGGNPFFVTDIVGSADASIPASIRNAFLARASRISVEGRLVLDAAAVIGSIVDPDLVASVVGGSIDEAVDECLAAGIFRQYGDEISFRHALIREVVLESMSPARRQRLHRRILHIVEDGPASSTHLTRLAHHADGGRDRDAVLRYAPAAAREAATYGSHREAAAQFARALRFADGLPSWELAELLEAHSFECYLTGRLDVAIADRTRAVSLRQSAGDSLTVGDDLPWLSRFCWFSGRNVEATKHARAAIDVLESLPPCPELAMAYSNFSQLRMLAHDAAEAITWGERAIELAVLLNDQPGLAHALTNVGAARLITGTDGRRLIEQGARIARKCGLHDDVTRALTNLSYMALEHHDLDAAEQFIAEGLAFASDHDLIATELYLRALRSKLWLSRGVWDGAATEADAAANHPSASVPTRILAHTILGQLLARRGGDSSAVLDDALRLAETTGELMRLGPVRAARAEAAWLSGDSELAAAEAGREYANASRSGDPWMSGHLALWLHRGGHRIDGFAPMAEPFAFEIKGDPTAAASFWRSRGQPLEEARALAQEGDEPSLRAALAIFDRLGATPDKARAVRALRSSGAMNIPRGPRPGTRANTAQLSARELEVLHRLMQGQTNREIAAALYLSPRTVGHHVSAILAKLRISSRVDARARAEALDLF